LLPGNRTRFGRTWWGQTWVEALQRIDRYTNRLPRGRHYAATGRVLEIAIEEETVRAAVQGTRRRPYEVTIRLRPFTRAEVSRLKAAVAEDPALAAELALGKLPAEMLDLLAGHGLSLLPASWDDLRARCSCPDWANPCKHLAAVYYLLATETARCHPFWTARNGISSIRRSGRPTLWRMPLYSPCPAPTSHLVHSFAGVEATGKVADAFFRGAPHTPEVLPHPTTAARAVVRHHTFF